MEPYANTLISTAETLSLLENKNTVILDCRYSLADHNAGRKDYLKNHIPGAFYLDLGYDLSSQVIPGETGRHPLPNPEILASTLRSAGLNADSQVIVYDQLNGAYASRAWWLLNWLGHERVAVLNGGFAQWSNEKLPTDNQWPAPKEGTFAFSLHPDLIVHRTEVKETEERVIDSRGYERYTGEIEPIDPIAGHIEGAVCLPFAQNTEENGLWKSAEDLSNRFEDAHLLTAQNPIFYCGSGVTACHNILAYKIVTGRFARLYPGSWSEWINYYPAIIGG